MSTGTLGFRSGILGIDGEKLVWRDRDSRRLKGAPLVSFLRTPKHIADSSHCSPVAAALATGADSRGLGLGREDDLVVDVDAGVDALR